MWAPRHRLDLVSGQPADPLGGATWHTSGWVVIDSASLLLGDLDAFLAWRAAGATRPREYVLDGKLAFFETSGDVDCPVEKGFIDDEVVAVRVELYSDLAATPGSWEAIGGLTSTNHAAWSSTRTHRREDARC